MRDLALKIFTLMVTHTNTKVPVFQGMLDNTQHPADF